MLTDSTEARRSPNIVVCVTVAAIVIVCCPMVMFCFPIGVFVWLGLLFTPLIPLLAGYAGACPYCESSVHTTGFEKGGKCAVCKHRFIIRDGRFWKVS